MENWIITSRQTFEEKLDNPHQRFKFHSLLIFGFTGVSISYFEPIFFHFYLSFNTSDSLLANPGVQADPNAVTLLQYQVHLCHNQDTACHNIGDAF
jgi:hypothetical protein